MDVKDELLICLCFDIEARDNELGFDLARQSIQQVRIGNRPGNLDPNVFKQPEGIAFDSTGNLFITNEGRRGKGNILEFKLINKIPGLQGI